jgi:hypothetical protein
MKLSKIATSLGLAAFVINCALSANANIPAPKYAGDYISYGQSVGWTDPTGNDLTSRSQANIAQFTIDKSGKMGTINFLSYTIHNVLSPGGTTISTNFGFPLQLPLTLDHTHPEFGAGKALISGFPTGLSPADINFDFVAKLDPGASRVGKLFLNQTVQGTTNFPSNNASYIIAEVQ